MLELKKITKEYKIEDYHQKALDNVSICFRKNEFASILGPSGSGKTTLLNIIGGLDKYDKGDLIINEISTKDYKARDWDSYRNHRIGFVFQSYNLISHQSILSNVELALTLSGVSPKERRKRAKEALKKVGLEKHIKKRPSQLSGGQMQRVAIARALVNDPDILLADEPTGALDSETSVQIMEIIKEIAKDKLVIMVTHNPDLAKKYSTRIIKLKDGKIEGDSKPYDGKVDTKDDLENQKKKTKKTSMSLLTALSLSLNNLMTKKGRTILTSFAGSIGIIGIALILSLSSGVNDYINDVQKDTMLSYPIQIQAETFDLSSILENSMKSYNEEKNHNKDAVYSDMSSIERASIMMGSTTKNNLTEFKKYLDNKDSEINKYIGENGVHYKYSPKFKLFSYDVDNKLINADGSTFETKNEYTNPSMYQSSYYKSIFGELAYDNNDENKVSKTVTDNYEIVKGNYPSNYNELVLVLDKNNEISGVTLYNLGLLPSSEYKEILDKLQNNEEVKIESSKINYDDIIGKDYYLLTASDFYIKGSNGLYEDISKNNGKTETLVKEKSLPVKIVGIIKLKEDSNIDLISETVLYPRSLTNYIIEHTNNSNVVKDQEANNEKNIINGLKFSIASDDEKVKETIKYLKSLSSTEKANIASLLFSGNSNLNMSDTEAAYALDAYLLNPDKKVLIKMYDEYLSPGSLEDNLKEFGKINLDSPSEIDIYADTFEDKDGISSSIDKYNEKASEDNKITYTDYIGLLMSSVTNIVNIISYVLIAFVSISLIVSSIMIAIITYISVLERTKEIGILRAIGASKKDIRRVFNAETFIEGFIAGLFGIIITLLLNIPINSVVYKLTDINGITHLPLIGAIILILISVILTVIAGLIPSNMAAKKEAVVALRTE